MLLYKGEPGTVESPPLEPSPHRHAPSHEHPQRSKHRQTVIVTRAALDYSAAVCERPHSASASNPHEQRSVATTQNTLPRSYLRLHVAARNSSQRCPPHQLTCVRTLTACAPAQRACAPSQPVVAENATQPTDPSHDARKLVAHALLGPQLAVDPLLLLFPIGARSPYPLLQLLLYAMKKH